MMIHRNTRLSEIGPIVGTIYWEHGEKFIRFAWRAGSSVFGWVRWRVI